MVARIAIPIPPPDRLRYEGGFVEGVFDFQF